jgi:hypothetical protein
MGRSIVMKISCSSTYTILLRNLESKGMNGKALRRFAKDLMFSFTMNPAMERSEINKRLHVLGWDDIDIDYRTWELAKASFDLQNEGT